MVPLGKISLDVFTDFGVDFVCADTELEKSNVNPIIHMSCIGFKRIIF